MLGNFGMIPWILTIIPVRENSEVVIIYPDNNNNSNNIYIINNNNNNNNNNIYVYVLFLATY